MHHHGCGETGQDVRGILHPEHRHVENEIPHGAAADPRDHREPHEPHHVHALARCDQRSGHRKYDRGQNVKKLNQTKQVLGVDQCGGHTLV
jgi:hypothetical protein